MEEPRGSRGRRTAKAAEGDKLAGDSAIYINFWRFSFREMGWSWADGPKVWSLNILYLSSFNFQPNRPLFPWWLRGGAGDLSAPRYGGRHGSPYRWLRHWSMVDVYVLVVCIKCEQCTQYSSHGTPSRRQARHRGLSLFKRISRYATMSCHITGCGLDQLSGER